LFCALVIATAVVAGCDGGRRAVTVESDSSNAALPRDTTGLASDVTAPPVGTREVLVALSGEGLQFVDAGSGRTRLVPFGWEQGTVEGPFQALGRIGERRTCGSGLDGVRAGEGLTLWFDGGTFVGWSADGSDALNATTMAGIGVGSTRAEMDSVIGGTFVDGPDGVLFASGGLRGLLDGPSGSATIRFISAGTVCGDAP
jgi:hypothetical protein